VTSGTRSSGRTLISGGTVVTATGRSRADVLVDGETIAAILAPGQAETLGVAGGSGADSPSDVEVIDATGKYVVPGGVDVHTHMELPFGGTFASDTFETGTVAAAWGGVTTIVDFAVQRSGENVLDGLAEWHTKADGNCAIDYGFHQIIGGVDDDALKAMTYLVDNEGITSFKLFMAYPGVFYSDDGQILRALQNAGESGAVIMMHAENGIAIDVLIAQALARGETDPKYHSFTRPAGLEGEATNRAIQLAKVAGNVPLYIVHLSASEALEEVAEARHRGQNVFAETCPQYLYLSIEDQLAQPGFEGAKWVCSTPLRSKHEHHHRDLWKGLRTNELAVVSTDHCPFCMKEQKELGLGNFAAIPNGIGGVEHRMELLYQGVVNGELSLERWVETCATTPARMFGLPGKGAIAPGYDADILVWDPNGHTSIGYDTANGKKHHMNMDHSAWEGFEIDGKVDTVMSRGTVVIRDDQYVGRKGHGRFVKRGLSEYVQ
jgi:dihydropyrimidinase